MNSRTTVPIAVVDGQLYRTLGTDGKKNGRGCWKTVTYVVVGKVVFISAK